MSGLAGLVMRGEAPADPALLTRMAACLAARGPDATGSRAPGNAGLVHSLLRTGDVCEDVPQPLTLDGRCWIVADARLDARDELVHALAAGGVQTAADRPAAELILHAVALWGDAAPVRLRGDFVFAHWDAERRRLLCARDHFGFKPLYYADLADAFVFSNSLDCVRAYPGVGAALDEGWIADFLIHGDPREMDSTVYAAVRQLPSAHTLVLQDGRVSLRRYWSLPEDTEPLRLRRPEEYAERFGVVLDQAVADRLPRSSAAILLSGGRDSTALAATWRGLVDRGVLDTTLRAYTAHHARLMPDEEPRFAGMAADHLGIPHALLAVDDHTAFGRWEAPELYRPQPSASPLLAVEADLYGAAAQGPRVLVTGQGGDALLRESTSRLTRLLTGRHALRAAREALQYLRVHRRIPRPGVRTWWAARGAAPETRIEIPAWVDPAFAGRVNLRERIAAWLARRDAPSRHPLRPEAHAALGGVIWPILGTLWDPGSTGIPIEARHPFFDLRLVELALSIPPAQWYNDKGLLVLAMRGRLPAAVIERGKTPVAGDPLRVRAQAQGEAWLGGRSATENVAPWVDLARLPRLAGGRSQQRPPESLLHREVRPLALSLWLTRIRHS